MQHTTRVSNKTTNHDDANGQPVICVTFQVKGGLGTYHAYMDFAESKQYEVGDGIEYELTLNAKVKAAAPTSEREPLPASTDAAKP